MLKKIILASLFTCSIPILAFSQSHELRVGITSGSSNFTGPGSDSRSNLNGSSPQDYYTNNPFGVKYGINLGGAINYRYVFSNNFLLGVEGAFERLQTKIYLQSTENTNNTIGMTKLNQQFLNFNPFIGYRFSFEPITLDMQLGVDIANTLQIKEKGSIEDNKGNETEFEKDRGKDIMKMDLRPRLQFNVNYNRYTVFAGYAWGTKNYKGEMDGASSSDAARLNVFRLGLQFQLLRPSLQ